MTATEPLIRLLSNGIGSWFAQCRWCRESSPSVNCRDDLRVLAAAKVARWLVRPSDTTCADDGPHVVVCPTCRRQRGEG